jgi:hypothetical protein
VRLVGEYLFMQIEQTRGEEITIMKRLAIALASIVLAIVGAVVPASAQTQKPNILVIWGDDIGISNISAYNLGVMGYRTRTLIV